MDPFTVREVEPNLAPRLVHGKARIRSRRSSLQVSRLLCIPLRKAVTYLRPASQVPRDGLPGGVVSHEFVLFAGHFGEQELCLHLGKVGKACKLLGVNGATESADEAFAVEEGDYDPDNGGDHGSLNDGGAHVPGCGRERTE